MWKVGIFETRSGSPEILLPASEASWESRLTGQGRGAHTIPLFNANLPQSLSRELSRGNRYTICQMWDDHVAFAGVIQRRRYSRPTRTLRVESTELRGAYFNARLIRGVGVDYEANPIALSVSSISHSEVVRDVIYDMTTGNGADWLLPIDLPATGSGGFTAEWRNDERLKWEDYYSQIEADGCEIYHPPYVDGSGYLRWDTVVQTKVSISPTTAISLDAPAGPISDLETLDDYTGQVTGIRGFGKGGQNAPSAWAAYPSGGTPVSVRDTWVNFSDLDEARLQSAVDELFDANLESTEQWGFGVNIHPDGPAPYAPGRRLDLSVTGDEFIPDGTREMRVVGVRGSMGLDLNVEAQDAA